MKMKKVLGLGALLIAMALSTTGCGKDDKETEILPDPMENTTEYYLVGTVTNANNAAVTDAEVKITDAIKAKTDAKGNFSLTVDKKAEYTVSIKATGLQDFSTKVSIAASAANRSTMTVNVKMSKVVEYSAPKTVKAGEETKITTPAPTTSEDTAPAVEVAVPANAVAEGTKISVGNYEEAKAIVTTPPAAGDKEEKKQPMSSIDIKVEPATAKAISPIVIGIASQSTNNGIYFDVANMVAQKDGGATSRAWEDFDSKVTFKDGNYQITIKEGQTIAGKYATLVKSTVAASKEQVGEANLANGAETVKKDNSGNISGIKDFEIKVAIKSGWEYATAPAAALKAIGAEDAKLTVAIDKQIQTTEGKQQVYTTERILKTNISGNSILYYQNKAKYCTKTFTYKVMVNGTSKDAKVVLKCYTGSEEKYTNQSANQHSGGGTQ